eukprot:TRINITY_DN5491_c0_g1_i1.p3 TRINITY_DN5491_c0_g1~~TRINITY_DN5491_c0_g1_i1.p3  ORF type:complete len:58 (-),score=1.37 TRINITY_DN5491_c0_g1_i1:237-410(-)
MGKMSFCAKFGPKLILPILFCVNINGAMPILMLKLLMNEHFLRIFVSAPAFETEKKI